MACAVIWAPCSGPSTNARKYNARRNCRWMSPARCRRSPAPVTRAPVARARKLGAVRLREHHLLDERRDAVLLGLAHRRPRRHQHAVRLRQRGRVAAGGRSPSRCSAPSPTPPAPARSWVVGFTLAPCVACAMIGVLGPRTLPIAGAETIGGAALPAQRPPGLGDARLRCSWRTSSPTSPTRPRSRSTTRCCPSSSRPRERGRLSGVGTALGYVGTIVGAPRSSCPSSTAPSRGVGALPGAARRHAARHRPLHGARRARRHLRADRAALPALLAAALPLLPRPRPGEGEGAGERRHAPSATSGRRCATRASYPGVLRFIARVVPVPGRHRHDRRRSWRCTR